jgi:HTH-like domain/Integrase core domain
MLEVSEKGYANWRKRGKSQRKRDDELITARIEDAYDQHRGHYGSPRIHAELRGQGISCGRRRVARLMQENQLSARKKRRKVRTTDSHHQFPVAPNLLEQDFTAHAPNEKWLTDFTYIDTREGWLFLAGVLDTYSRKIVGWSMSEKHDVELVKAALRMAVIQRQPGADRGRIIQIEAVNMPALAINCCCVSKIFRQVWVKKVTAMITQWSKVFGQHSRMNVLVKQFSLQEMRRKQRFLST